MNILQQEIQNVLAENSHSLIPTADFSKVAELLKTHPELVNYKMKMAIHFYTFLFYQSK
ncbi:MAG: hypothetical protein IKZ02_04215 [Alphaproteobacteria bacterium]|nr:hypothetical protein [Alphaproteobacteria bacterium]